MPHYPASKGQSRNLKESRKRTRYASPEEWAALLEGCGTQQQRDILTIAVATGLREQNIRGLMWSQVDLERRQITILPDQHLVRTKNDEPIVVPLTKAAVSVLAGTIRHCDSPYVFWHPGPPVSRFASFANWWQAARRRSGVKNFRFHYIRHTFARTS